MPNTARPCELCREPPLHKGHRRRCHFCQRLVCFHCRDHSVAGYFFDCRSFQGILWHAVTRRPSSRDSRLSRAHASNAEWQDLAPSGVASER